MFKIVEIIDLKGQFQTRLLAYFINILIWKTFIFISVPFFVEIVKCTAFCTLLLLPSWNIEQLGFAKPA